MSKFGFHVIDADGHGGEPADWFDRLPDAFKPQWQERTQRIKQHFANLPGVGVMKTHPMIAAAPQSYSSVGSSRVSAPSRAASSSSSTAAPSISARSVPRNTIVVPGPSGRQNG
jgi:hypothetical protein